jgi:hypothetical protein
MHHIYTVAHKEGDLIPGVVYRRQKKEKRAAGKKAVRAIILRRPYLPLAFLALCYKGESCFPSSVLFHFATATKAASLKNPSQHFL